MDLWLTVKYKGIPRNLRREIFSIISQINHNYLIIFKDCLIIIGINMFLCGLMWIILYEMKVCLYITLLGCEQHAKIILPCFLVLVYFFKLNCWGLFRYIPYQTQGTKISFLPILLNLDFRKIFPFLIIFRWAKVEGHSLSRQRLTVSQINCSRIISMFMHVFFLTNCNFLF